MAKKQKRAERDVQDAAEELRPITTRLSQLKGTIEGLVRALATRLVPPLCISNADLLLPFTLL
jgi:hypothetical protein